MMGLTQRQRDLLVYLQKCDESGFSPSFQDMADALDVRSKSGISRIVNALEERGYIRRIPNAARAIELISQDAGVVINGDILEMAKRAAKLSGKNTEQFCADAIIREASLTIARGH